MSGAMGECNVCMHMLHDFTDAWNMIVCTVCQYVLFLTWVGYYETTLGINVHTFIFNMIAIQFQVKGLYNSSSILFRCISW